jgi:hypothetical protein
MVQLEELPPGLMAYPNPVTNGKLFLDFISALKSEASVTISDLAGKVVFSTIVAAGTRVYTIDLSRSPAGAYMLKAFSAQSNFQQVIVIR